MTSFVCWEIDACLNESAMPITLQVKDTLPLGGPGEDRTDTITRTAIAL